MGESGRQLIAIETLRSACTARLTEVGIARDSAERIVQELIDAELSGKPTHGVVRVPWLASKLGGRRFSSPVLERKGPHLSILRSKNAIGYEAAQIAAEHCAASASTHEAHFCICTDAFPTGVLGYYLRPSLRRGLIGLAFASTPPLVSVAGSATRLLGTEPIAVGVPIPDADPVVCDVASAPATFGEILLALHLPERFNWTQFADVTGAAVTDPRALFGLDGGFTGSIRGPDPTESPRSFALLVGLRLLSIALGGFESGGCLVVGALQAGLIDAEAPRRLADFVARNEQVLGGSDLPGRRSARQRREALAAGAISLPLSIARELGIVETSIDG